MVILRWANLKQGDRGNRDSINADFRGIINTGYDTSDAKAYHIYSICDSSDDKPDSLGAEFVPSWTAT